MVDYGPPPHDDLEERYEREACRLEAVTTCVGFDDLLDVTLSLNHSQVDTMIVVTTHGDRKTQRVARKHGVMCVQTDLFGRHGRKFNKGAAINAGFDRFQFFGWRLHIDADCILPDNFRRILFNHTHLETDCIYGADRVDVLWPEGFAELRDKLLHRPQWNWRALIEAQVSTPLAARYTDALRGYVPLGFFQLWHARCQKSYPNSLGTASHDDIMFASEWPRSRRRLLPTTVCYHLVARRPQWGENWDGNRKQPRIDKDKKSGSRERDRQRRRSESDDDRD
jgi:hypothetical protein